MEVGDHQTKNPGEPLQQRFQKSLG